MRPFTAYPSPLSALVNHLAVHALRRAQGPQVEGRATQQHERNERQREHAIDEHIGSTAAAEYVAKRMAVGVPAAGVCRPLTHPAGIWGQGQVGL